MVRILALASTLACVAGKTVKLATFDGVKETTLPFTPVNDPVMGGQSKSNFTVESPIGIFEGAVAVVPFLGSPGFCNLEAPGFGRPAIDFPDITGTDGITVVAKQTLDNGLTNFDVAIVTSALKTLAPQASWGADFEFQTGKSEYFIPYTKFGCYSRGNPLTTCGNLMDQLGDITQIGIGSDGVAGPFRVELTSISADSKPALTAENDISLVTFDGADEATTRTWRQQNDPVMGGESRGTFSVTDGAGVMDGTVAIVPKLSAPGFIQAFTTDKKAFPDVSTCSGLTLTVKSSSTPSSYPGYRISFGSDVSRSDSCDTGFYARGFKADFTAPENDFGVLKIPFSSFTRCWNDATGDAVKTCKDDSRQCPTSERLANLQTLTLWAEGHAADVTLSVSSIGAYGCSAMLVV